MSNGKLYEMVLAGFNDKPIEDLIIGSAYVGVRIGTRIGVAHRIDDIIKLTEMSEDFIGEFVADLIYSKDPLEAAIATAAINAQLKPKKLNKGNIFNKILDSAENYRSIAVIGKFPIIEQLRQLDCELYLFEKKELPGFLPAEKEKDILPDCELVIITGTAFINKTLEQLLGLSNGYTIVVGPSTPMTEVLLNFGADVLAGIVCTNPKVLDMISLGGGTKEFKKYVDVVYLEK